MPKFISDLLVTIVDYVWGMPLLVLLMGGGLVLLVYSKFLPLLGFGHAIRLVSGNFHHDGESKAPGQITHFQALTNALAATIGLGNIAGVAIAITQGGAGAIFWMWVAALIGMNTKFFECTLSVMFRGKDYLGETQGGPMYVIKQKLSGRWQFLAYMFAACGLVGTLALLNINQLAQYTDEYYHIPTWITGVLSAIAVFIIASGGIKRIASATSKLVPLMCVLYVISSLVVILINVEKVPGVFISIITLAFTGKAAIGGAIGIGVIQAFKIGIKRAAFSNEAGIGTAAMAHSNVKTNEPISEGYVAMLGPFLDTIVVCTMTALVILTTLTPADYGNLSGVLLTTKAFEAALPGFGKHFLGLAIFLFSITTMIGMANYNEKCWNFLFKGRSYLKKNTALIFFCSTIVLGAVTSLDDAINLLDIGFALMAFPNMIATIKLAPQVKQALKDYNKKYLAR